MSAFVSAPWNWPQPWWTIGAVLEGIWFLTTFLDFGSPKFGGPLNAANISYVESDDDAGFSQVNVKLGNGQEWRIEVERVS